MGNDNYEWGQGPRLRCLRMWLGLSPKDMALALGVSDRSYTSFESGRAAVPAGILEDVNILIGRYQAEAQRIADLTVIDVTGWAPAQLRVVGAALLINPGLVVVADERASS